MGVTNALLHDHEELRRQVARLERLMTTACSCGPIRQRCRALACILGAHIAREDAALAACSRQLGEGLQRPLPDHMDEAELLHDVERFIQLEGDRCPAYALALHLVPVIRALRAHMRQEEEELFPLVDRVEAERQCRCQDNPGGSSDERPRPHDGNSGSMPADR
jgi:hemerythrin-like domain-containing protein